MKVIVLGGGVIGVSTAWQLARAGADVTVVDRQAGPALETSHANAGQVSPGYSTPWAAPGIPLKAAKWLFQRHAPLAIRPDGTLWQLQWLAAMLRECTSTRYAVNKERMMRLAEYSRRRLHVLRDEAGIEYEGRALGTLQLFRTAAQLDAAARDVEVLRACGVPFELLDVAGCLRAEPGLAQARASFVGGLRLPLDETGDCRLFTERLAERCAQAGVRFEWNLAIDGLQREGDRVAGVVTGRGTLRADRYVLALGSYSRPLALGLGLALPVYPLKGYSLTVPIVDARSAPVSTVMDETHKVAITRFDERIRVGGMAEVAGFDLRLNPRRRATLEKVVRDLFPRGGDLARAEFWTGLRPMTPDGTPLVGASGLSNLWLNTGHGTLGWTMAAGSAKVVADLVTGRTPDIRTDDLSLPRYRRTPSVGTRLRPATQHG